MENQLQIFENAEFGQVRTIVIDNEPWFVGRDVAEILGYNNPNEAIQDHVDNEDKFIRSSKGRELLKLFNSLKEIQKQFGRQDNWFINESGLYSLIFTSKLPAAKVFKHWITHEVLPAIRKTGSYELDEKQKAKAEIEKKKLEIQAMRVQAMLLNAKTKQAKVIAELAKTSKLPTYQNALIATAAKVVTGEEVIALPTSESGRERHPLGWYCKFFNKKETWATYLGKMLKKQGIEKIHGKTGELIEFVDDNNNQRQGFEWYSDYLLPIVKNMAEVS